jgi:HPr kinase/phosphorylase
MGTVKRIESITVEHFFKTYGSRLKLELVGGAEGIKRQITEPGVNRPSLALTGFTKYFAAKRIQVIGAGEMTYLKSLSEETQVKRLFRMADFRIPCLVLCRNFNPPKSILKLAEKKKIPVFRSSLLTLRFLNAATLCTDNEFSPTTTEHGVMIDIKGVGVLIRGESGSGKSEAALALIERGYSLVADDLVRVRIVDERELIATSDPLNRGYMECRGIGIIDVAEMFGIKSLRVEKRVDLVVSLKGWNSGVDEDRTGLEQNFFSILGVQVPHVELYVRPGRDMARLIEVSALVQALRNIGHDPAVQFNERLIAHMAGEVPPTPAPAFSRAGSL